MPDDEDEAVGRKLDAASKPVSVTRFNSMIHDNDLLNAIRDESGELAAITQSTGELRARLNCFTGCIERG